MIVIELFKKVPRMKTFWTKFSKPRNMKTWLEGPLEMIFWQDGLGVG